MKKTLYTVTLVLLVAVFAFSAFYVVNYMIDSKAQKDEMAQLQQMKEEAAAKATETTAPTETAEAPATEETQETEPAGPTEPQILPDYSELYKMNNDLSGWITIAGTDIDYPVMQTPEEFDFYLKRNFGKENSPHGCIFVGEGNDLETPSDNVTLYGHNMLDGSMFAGLHKYTEKEKWEENSLIIFNTLYEYHVYKIFAVFKTTASVDEGFKYHRFVNAENEAEFNTFVNECKRLSFYDTGITPVYGDKIICLSTCEYTLTNGRLVVAAVRIS